MSKIKMRCITCGKWFQSANAKEVTCPDCTQKARKEKLAAKNAPPAPANRPVGPGTTRQTPPPKPKAKPEQSGTSHWFDALDDIKVAEPDQPARPKPQLPSGPRETQHTQQPNGFNAPPSPPSAPGARPQEHGPGEAHHGERGYGQRGPGGYHEGGQRGPGGYREGGPREGGYSRGPGGYREGGYNRGPGGYREGYQGGGPREGGYNRGPGGYRQGGDQSQPGPYGQRPRPPYDNGAGRGPRPERPGQGRPMPNRPLRGKPGRPAAAITKPKREKIPPPQPFEPSTEQVEKVEQRYLELAKPSEYDGIRTQIATEVGIPKKAVKKIIKDLRDRQHMPSWWEVQTYKGSNEELERIKEAYLPLLPIPPVGVHKILAEKLSVKPGVVYQAIKAIRLEMNLPQYNDPSLHGDFNASHHQPANGQQKTGATQQPEGTTSASTPSEEEKPAASAEAPVPTEAHEQTTN
ncbi:hypothetical protein [Ktedonobacter sp. SOSP1-85]|uniref:hypothetical protein n=1 Tax=Ktedonobacter sp. SOSP1-85 TaxID=2778367 RepID=UPI001916A998|nr:hypothetical protein [Ktedonobacter sp. SOSP1-85]